MTRYTVQPRDGIFVKDYISLTFVRNMGKNVGKNKSKILSGKYSQKIFDHAKQSMHLKMHLKLLQKNQFKKQQKQLVNWLAIKLLMKLQDLKNFITELLRRKYWTWKRNHRERKKYISRT